MICWHRSVFGISASSCVIRLGTGCPHDLNMDILFSENSFIEMIFFSLVVGKDVE